MALRMSVVVLSAFSLVACGKVAETATEKVIESKLSKDGNQAKVDLSGGGLKMRRRCVTRAESREWKHHPNEPAARAMRSC